MQLSITKSLRKIMEKLTNTHVLVDEQGIAILSGTEAEMREAELELLAQGIWDICVRTEGAHHD
jgi:rRNA processing protein Krr1/Pno1